MSEFTNYPLKNGWIRFQPIFAKRYDANEELLERLSAALLIEKRRGVNRIPCDILTVITASYAIIHVDKESLAGKIAIIMAPEL